MKARLTTPGIVFAMLLVCARPLASPQAGTSNNAVLSGTLLAEGPLQPVKRAAIRLAGPAGTSVRLVGTDDQGRFVFPALPAGSYSLSATKTGYVEAFYGSNRPGRGPGEPIAIANGQRVTVTLRILPGAVITGTLTDVRGNPLATVPVAAVDVRSSTTASPPARGMTDERGVYRIYGLMPGDYVVAALPRNAGFRPGVDVLSVTDAEVQWARGLGLSPTPSAPPPSRVVNYAPVYYPGTTNVNAAARITVAAGEERAEVGFPIPVVTTATVGGTLVDDTGQPLMVTTSVSLYPRFNDTTPADALIASGTLKLPTVGVSVPSFWVAGVAPGEYTLVARTGSPGRAEAGVSPAKWSVTDLTVDGRDQPDIILRLEPGVRISGSIVFERAAQTPPADLSALDISLIAPNSRIVGPVAPQATVDPAGRFVFPSVVRGRYALKVTAPVANATATWTLKSAMLNGQDLADVPLEIRNGQDITGLTVTFTERGSEISGRVVDAGGQPVRRYSIVVFTVDQSLWLPGARRIRSTNPSADGAFSVPGLPAGEYAIAAADGVEASDLADPAFLAKLLATAHRITLAEGEKKTQDLRIGGGLAGGVAMLVFSARRSSLAYLPTPPHTPASSQRPQTTKCPRRPYRL